jgi:flagellar protein FlaJ
MVSPLWYLPSLAVVAIAAAWLLAKGEGRVDRIVGRFARVLLGRFVTESADRKQLIESAYIGQTYRSYASRTLFYAALAFLAGAIGGGYVVAGILVAFEAIVRLLSGLPSAIRRTFGFRADYELVLSDGTWWALVLGGGLLIGMALAVLAYVLRWRLPEDTADVRRRSIDEGLPRTTAFMYALSRGGLEFPQIVRILGRNSGVYGEAANEMSIVVREMDLFGRDMITAIRRTAQRTPSEQFKTFSENLASVLQSGSSLPEFLRDQYERFRQDAEERQVEILELLATIAEAYVTVLVAGVLFFITILLVFGLTTTDTLLFLQMTGYLLMPLANGGFAVYLAQKLSLLGIARGSRAGALDRAELRTPTPATPETDPHRSDGGVARDDRTRETLAWHDRVSRFKSAVRNPLQTVTRSPTSLLYLTVPVAVLAFALRVPAALTGTAVNVRILDDLVVQSVLFVLVTYAAVREVYKRRIDRIEAATPELLERLASLNESGMTVTEGLDRVRGGDLGVLSPEIERIHRDIAYGSNVGDALVRFGRRVRTTAITRVVTLLTHAMQAGGQLGEVLRIAATQARADLRLRRQRRQQMFTYLIVIYISFAVFLVIILAVNEVLVPSLPESVPQPQSGSPNRLGVNTDQFARLGGVDKASYTLVFFHTALIQAVCAGFIGGQLGEGSIKDGTKHAAIMLSIAYVVFVLISSPVASVAATGVVSTGETVTVDSASLSEGGYVVAYDEGANGTLLGRSAYLEPGTHEDVVVSLEEPIRGDRSVVLVPHRETTGDGTFDYPGPPHLPGSSQSDRPYTTVSGSSASAVEADVVYTGG